MAITIGNKTYRNLQEQVYENVEQIEQANQDIDSLESTVSAHTSNLNTLNNTTIPGIQNDINTLNNTTIPGIQNDINTLDLEVGDKQDDVIEEKGDLVVGNSSGKATKFSGNSTSNKKYFSETSGTPSWSYIEATDLKTTGATFRQSVMAASGGGTYVGWVQGHDIASEVSAGYPLPADSGKVLTANGSNGASWEDVPQNFTGSTSGVGIVVSVGTNQLAGMSGSDGQFLKWVGAGPAFVTVPNAEDEEV